jgi:hypothetical protein
MLRKLIGAAAVAALPLALALSASPASASPAAVHPLTKHANTCNITETYCTIESEDSLFAYYNGGGAIANPAGTRFTWEGEDGSWGFLINAAGQCMQWSNSLDQLQANSACQAGNGAQYFWPYAGAPDGSEVIKQYDEGTGPNMEIPDLSGSYIQWVNGNNGGTALSWQQ